MYSVHYIVYNYLFTYFFYILPYEIEFNDQPELFDHKICKQHESDKEPRESSVNCSNEAPFIVVLICLALPTQITGVWQCDGYYSCLPLLACLLAISVLQQCNHSSGMYCLFIV